MRASLSTVLVGVVVVLIVASMSLFTVDQRQNAMVFRRGEVISVKTEPGLYVKMPVIDNVRFFDIRILTLDSEEPERFLTSENKNVLVDSFVKWRVTDVRQYYVSVGGDELRANDRLKKTVNSSLRDEFGKRTVHDGVSGGRFQENPEFYAFARSLEAYRQSFRSKGDLLILEPSSEFFKYLKNSSGRSGK